MRDDFCVVTCRACDLSACAKLELDVVDKGTSWDLAKRHAITNLDRSVFRGNKGVTDLKILRREHVAALAVCVECACDETGAVRIVLDGLNLCRHAVLVVGEIHVAVALLVAASLVAGRDASVAVASCLSLLGLQERLHWAIA